METYSQVTEQIGQNGRRGALMISLDCHHPDLEEFLDIKTDLNKVTKANISVRITDDFMEAVVNDTDFELSFVREATAETIKKTVRAKDLFMKLAENNWNYAEPGCLFWDRIENYNLLSEDPNFHYAGTNPCAEEPLPAGGSCLLGSLNLAEFVKEPFTPNARFDFADFIKAVEIATIALNEVLDEGLSLHPLQEQRDSVRDWRQIGLGIFGLADMLIKMGIEYGSEESLSLCDKIGQNMAAAAILQSADLAKESGSYPNFYYEYIKKSLFLETHIMAEDMTYIENNGLRNSQLLTIAPTGSISTMLGVSGGIEPIFANSYTRKTESLHSEDVYYKVYTPIVEQYMRLHDLTAEEQLPAFFITAGELDYKKRIAMQGVWQSHIDASISSTVNVPESFTIDDTFNLYVEAWKHGLKGVTIFRDNCKRTAILSTSTPKEESGTEGNAPKRGEVLPTRDDLIGLKRKLMTGCGSLHCNALFNPTDGSLCEIYLSKGSTGGCNNFMIGLSRMISAAARAGVSLEDIVEQLMSTGSCPSYSSRTATKHDTSKGSCCPMAVGYALKDMAKQFKELMPSLWTQGQEAPSPDASETLTKCPVCGDELTFSGGCNMCKSCGWSKCD
jgi:ribonucleoside-diphosphate reductase alpha chain